MHGQPLKARPVPSLSHSSLPQLQRVPRRVALPWRHGLAQRRPEPGSRAAGPGVRAAERVGQCCHTAARSSSSDCCSSNAGGPAGDSSSAGQQQPGPWWDAAAAPFRSSPYDSAILSLALPAVVALAADPLLSIIDTIFVGQAGAEPLAALGVNSALFTASFVVFNFLATATTPLVAAALAKGDGEKAGKVTVQALLLASVLGTVLWGGLAVGADGALALMGAGPEAGSMFEQAKDFLIIRAAASPAVLLATVGQGVFRGLQDMRTPLAITLGANAINLALDIVLIMGLGWGVSGAATATCTAEWAAAAAYLGLLWQRREVLGGLSLRSVLGDRAADAASEFLPFLKAGGAVLMRTALLLGTKTLASATAARLGPVPIASHQVVMQLWLLSSLVVDSVAIAGQTLVAVELGKGDVRAGRAVSDRLLQLGVAMGVVLAAGFWAAEPVIPRIFSSDAGIEAAVRSILPLAVFMLPANAAVYVLDGVLVGASDFKFMAGAMVVAAATAVGLLLGVEPLGLGLEGVWGAMALLMLSRLGTLMWRYQDPSGPLPPQGPAPAPAISLGPGPLVEVEPLPVASSSNSSSSSRGSLTGSSGSGSSGKGTGEEVTPGPAACGCVAGQSEVAGADEQQGGGSTVRVRGLPAAKANGRTPAMANNAVAHAVPSKQPQRGAVVPSVEE